MQSKHPKKECESWVSQTWIILLFLFIWIFVINRCDHWLSPQPLRILACKRIVWRETECQHFVLLDEFVLMSADCRKRSTFWGSAKHDSSCIHPSWYPRSFPLKKEKARERKRKTVSLQFHHTGLFSSPSCKPHSVPSELGRKRVNARFRFNPPSIFYVPRRASPEKKNTGDPSLEQSWLRTEAERTHMAAAEKIVLLCAAKGLGTRINVQN